VYVDNSGTFVKKNLDTGKSGTIYGYNAGTPVKNTAAAGNAAYLNKGTPKRLDTTAGPEVELDSSDITDPIWA
jgi:hypothetical protein